MSLRNKISIVVAGILLISMLDPGSSVLGEIAVEFIWDGQELGVLGVGVILWFSLHLILIFRKSQFYLGHRRAILVTIVILPLLLAAGFFGLIEYQDTQRELRKRQWAEQQEERRIRISKCQRAGELASILNPFCSNYFSEKNVLEQTHKKREFAYKGRKNLNKAWRDFLLKNRDADWVTITRSASHGDYVCFDFWKEVRRIKFVRDRNKDNLIKPEIDLLDKIADRFVTYLNRNSVKAAGMVVKWKYEDLEKMESNSSNQCGFIRGRISFLHRKNRYVSVIR